MVGGAVGGKVAKGRGVRFRKGRIGELRPKLRFGAVSNRFILTGWLKKVLSVAIGGGVKGTADLVVGKLGNLFVDVVGIDGIFTSFFDVIFDVIFSAVPLVEVVVVAILEDISSVNAVV